MTISPVSSIATRRRGFTLVEVMIGASLGSFVLAGILTVYIFLIKSGMSANNYSEMEAQSRRAFESFGTDARMASGLTTGTGKVTFSFTSPAVPADCTGTNSVTYAFDGTSQWLYRVPGDGSVLTDQRVLIRGVSALNFNRFDASDASTTTDTASKHVQVSVTVIRTATGLSKNTETILSAAFTMRNKM